MAPHSTSLSREDLVAKIREVAAEIGTERLGRKQFLAQSGLSGYTVDQHFDRWTDAVREADLAPAPNVTELPRSTKYSSEAIVAELRRVASLVGAKRLTREKFSRYGQISASAVARRFGDWSRALQAADLVPAGVSEPLTEETLINELCRVADELQSGFLTRADFRRLSVIDPHRVERAFGGWLNALARAGLGVSPAFKREVPLAALADEYLRISIKLGRLPTHLELTRRSRHAGDTFARKHGGYRVFTRRAIEHLLANGERIPPAVREAFATELKRSFTEGAPTLPIPVNEADARRFVPPACADLVTLSLNRSPTSAVSQGVPSSEFEKQCAVAFQMLGFTVKPYGQGRGRNADCIAIADREHYAVIVDAKARENGYELGTGDRTFLEYVTQHTAQLQSAGVERCYLAVVSSSFRSADAPALRKTLSGIGNGFIGFVFLEAGALLRMVSNKLQSDDRSSLGGLEHVFHTNGIYSA